MHQAVDALVETVAGGGVRDLSHDELTELTAAVRREQARLDAVLMEAVGEVDARGSYTLDGALTAGAWLRMTTRLTPGEASATVRTARVLRSGALPQVRAALGAGEVSGEHAQVIARGGGRCAGRRGRADRAGGAARRAARPTCGRPPR